MGDHKRHRMDPDRISELPEPLIIQILSLLDMKYAVRTGLLSSRWKNLWTQVDTIKFHYPDEDPSYDDVEEFISFVDNVLTKFTCSSIKTFSVTWAHDSGSERLDEVDNWVKFVVRNNVKFVKLGLKGLEYFFPDCFYKNSSFVGLELDGLSSTFEGNYLRLNNLKNLSLKCTRVGEGFIKGLQVGCPVLESIVFDDVKGFNEQIDIFSPSVKDLKLLNLGYDKYAVYDGDERLDNLRMYGFLKITAPFLEKLEIGGTFLGVQCELDNMSSLKNVSLTFNYVMADLSSLSGKAYLFYLAQENHFEKHPYALWVTMVRKILRPISHVEQIVIGSELIQALSLWERLHKASSTTFACKRLTIHSLISIYELPGILRLLRSTPLLETLVIKMTPSQVQSHFPSYCDAAFHVDDILRLASQKESIASMKKVEIDYGENSPCKDDGNEGDKCFDSELVVHILQSSPTVEKFVIRSSELNCSRYEMQYTSLLRNENLTGKKALEWKMSKRKGEFEFGFCNSTSVISK